MKTFSERLLAARKQLGLSQAAFAELGGAKKASQIRYESGETTPDVAYLSRLEAAGVDIAYLLTGKKLVEREEITPLQAFDRVLQALIANNAAQLANEERMTPLIHMVVREGMSLEAITEFIGLALRFKSNEPASTAVQTFNAAVGQAAGRDLINKGKC